LSSLRIIIGSVILIHLEEIVTVPIVQMINKCSLFQNNLTIAGTPYRVQSSVHLAIFQEFVSALEGKMVNITETNFTELKQLCEEFGFNKIAAKLSEFRSSMGLKETEDANACERIETLEEKSQQHDHTIVMFQKKLMQLSINFQSLSDKVSTLRFAAARVQTLSDEVSALKVKLQLDCQS
jgi:septal ring factor EnvC (AmiA/AmiB activator)